MVNASLNYESGDSGIGISIGMYTLDGFHLHFSVEHPGYKAVEFYGTIKPGDVLDLEWLSHATGDKGRET